MSNVSMLLNSGRAPERPPRRLGDVKDVESRTHMNARTIYRYAELGLMPYGYKIGTLRRWDLDEIERWISAGCKPVRQDGGPQDEAPA
jgi:predicted DNA-binding transcriptional regulator AlpA